MNPPRPDKQLPPPSARPPEDDPLYGEGGQRRPLTRAERMIGVRHMVLGTLVLLALLLTLALCSLPR